jgi:hypothetical protein
MAFGVFFFGVFTYLSITQSLFMGSEYFMLYEDLDKVGRHNDILVCANLTFAKLFCCCCSSFVKLIAILLV